MQLVAEGKTNRQIANVLVLSDKTVKRHLDNVFSKLGVSSRAAATAALLRKRQAGPNGPSHPLDARMDQMEEAGRTANMEIRAMLHTALFRGGAILVFVVGPIAGCSRAQASTPVRIQVVGTVSEAPLYLATERGYFAENNITPEFITLDSAARSIPALANGEIDVAAGVLSAGLFNAVNSGINIRIVAPQSENRGCEHSSTWILLRKDLADSGAIRTPADLRGRNIALVSSASSVEYVADALLRSGNLQPSDAFYVEMGLGDMGAAFASQRIDAAVGGEPTATTYVEKHLASKWLCASDVIPNLQYTYILFSPRFAEKRADTAQAWMDAYLSGARDWQTAVDDPQARRSAVEVLSRYTPAKDVELLERVTLPWLAPQGSIDLENIRNQVAWARERGYIDREPATAMLVDSRFVDQATRFTSK